MSPYQQMLTRDHFHNSVSDIFMRSEQFCPSHPSANWTQCSGRCGPRQLDKLAVKIGENYHGATQTFVRYHPQTKDAMRVLALYQVKNGLCFYATFHTLVHTTTQKKFFLFTYVNVYAT